MKIKTTIAALGLFLSSALAHLLHSWSTANRLKICNLRGQLR